MSDGIDLLDPASLWPESPDDPVPGADGTERRWIWEELTPKERRERLEELSPWVAWLVENFNLQATIPQCWYRHLPVLHHLTALYLGWVRTFTARTEGRDLAEAEWLATLHNLKQHLQIAGCISAGKHQDTVVRAWHTSISDLRDYAQTSDWGQVEPYNPAEPLPLPEPAAL